MTSTGADELETYAQWVSGFDLDQLPESALKAAKACVLYGLAVGIATIKVPSVRTICEAVDSDGASGGVSTRLLDGARVSIGNAALANSVLLSGRAQGDSHNAGHIGGVVIPSALAVAEARGLTGAEMLASAVVGYESGLRIGRDHASALSVRGFRTTPTYGVFAAAAVGARAARLSPDGVANALSLGANLASGLREYVNAGTQESPFQAGFAARNGLTASLLAATGFEAGHTSLHGPAGFFDAYGGPDSDHGSRLLDDLGSQFEFTTVTYKPYPACQFLRGSVRAAIDLGGRAGRRAPKSIELALNPYEADFIGVRFGGPFSSPAQTVMSAPFCVALGWATGEVSYGGMRTYDDPRVLEVVPRVRVIGDPDVRRYQTRMRAELEDGAVLEVDDGGSAASYEIAWEPAVEATRQLVAEVGVSGPAVDRLIATVDGLERADDVSGLIAATRAIVDDAPSHA